MWFVAAIIILFQTRNGGWVGAWSLVTLFGRERLESVYNRRSHPFYGHAKIYGSVSYGLELVPYFSWTFWVETIFRDTQSSENPYGKCLRDQTLLQKVRFSAELAM